MDGMRFAFNLITLTVLLTSCKSYYNDTIEWMDNIELGTKIEEVKKTKPDYVEINWNKPDTIDNQIRFKIIKIRGNKDILAMEHYLVFVDKKFEGHESHK